MDMQEVNVRVAVRVRPILPREKVAGEQSCARVIPNTKQIVLGEGKGFTFDHVFSQKSTQNDVYDTCVQPLVDNIFEGYNSTVFAYGQTGSGKTYTMGTTNQETLMESEKGIIPRAVSRLFSIIRDKVDSVRFTISVSYIEIYKEEVRDLLEPDAPGIPSIHIREDEHGNTVVSGVQERVCSTAAELLDCLELGSSSRATGSTQMNELSSRSHCVFSICVCQEWEETSVINRSTSDGNESARSTGALRHCMSGKFHFVDLAGSERAYKTGNVGDRFKESIHINSGLLALGNVISALGDPKKKKLTHIPYRDSKITRLLKDSLGGNARTLMICCISPVWSDCDESNNSLKYANRARNIRNKPVLNRDKNSIRLEKMQNEIELLREQLTRHATCTSNLGADAGGKLKDVGRYEMMLIRAQEVLEDITSRRTLTSSLALRVDEWIRLATDEKGALPCDRWNDETVSDLRRKLERAHQDLNNDEEIFAEKSRELNSLREAVKHLEAQLTQRSLSLEMAEQRIRDQGTQLVELQRRIAALDELEDEDVGEFAPPTARRIRSVPATQCGVRQSLLLDAIEARNVKTSPAQMSLDAVMHGFRVRSQMLASQLEDEDTVLKHEFEDSSETSKENADLSPPGAFKRRGTFRVKHQTNTNAMHGALTEADVTNDAGSVEKDTAAVDKEVKTAHVKLAEANQKLRDLNLSIRMKEDLIKQLAKSNKEAQTLNSKYEERIQYLQEEKQTARKEIEDLQHNLKNIPSQKTNAGDVAKTKAFYEQKLEETHAKLQQFSRQQRELEELSACMSNRDKRIRDLENRITVLRQEHECAEDARRDAQEAKERVQRERNEDRRRIEALERQQEVTSEALKRKQEEVAAAKRQLQERQTSARVEENKRFLDNEIERVLQKGKQIEELEEEICRREQIVAKKEELLTAKSEMEMRRLRASQSFAEDSDIAEVSSRLHSADAAMDGKRREMQAAASERSKHRLAEEMRRLAGHRADLQAELGRLQRQQENEEFDSNDERRLSELMEMIESLNVAIRHKDDCIKKKEDQLHVEERKLATSQNDLQARLGSLPSQDIRQILLYYFDKVISLKEEMRRMYEAKNQHDIAFSDSELLCDELRRKLERQAVEHDRQLTAAQQRYEGEVQLLTHHLRQAHGAVTTAASRDSTSCHCSSAADLAKALSELKDVKRMNKEMKLKIRDWYHQGLIKMDSKEHKDAPHLSRRQHQQSQQAQQSHLGHRDYHAQEYASSSAREANYRSWASSVGRYSEISSAAPHGSESRKQTPLHPSASVLSRPSTRDSSRPGTAVYDSLEDPRNQ